MNKIWKCEKGSYEHETKEKVFANKQYCYNKYKLKTFSNYYDSSSFLLLNSSCLFSILLLLLPLLLVSIEALVEEMGLEVEVEVEVGIEVGTGT